MKTDSQILIYENMNGEIHTEVRLDAETVWLSQKQISKVFDKNVKTINEHLGNIFSEGELQPEATIRKFRIVRREGQRQVKREIEHYNLDAIISVGYRVNSKQGTRFRIWATNILRQHLIEGYSLNEKRLSQRNIEMAQAVALLSLILSDNKLVNTEGTAILSVVRDYARSWHLLQAYDEQSLKALTLSNTKMAELKLDEAMTAIVELKTVKGRRVIYSDKCEVMD